MAGSAAIAAVPFCREWRSTRFCSKQRSCYYILYSPYFKGCWKWFSSSCRHAPFLANTRSLHVQIRLIRLKTLNTERFLAVLQSGDYTRNYKTCPLICSTNKNPSTSDPAQETSVPYILLSPKHSINHTYNSFWCELLHSISEYKQTLS
jgi:hypothetical protein